MHSRDLISAPGRTARLAAARLAAAGDRRRPAGVAVSLVALAAIATLALAGGNGWEAALAAGAAVPILHPLLRPGRRAAAAAPGAVAEPAPAAAPQATSRHDLDGGVLSASPALAALADCADTELSGGGLFARVHVADRPAYMTALSEARHRGAAHADIRLRRGSGRGSGWIRLVADMMAAGDGCVHAAYRDARDRSESPAATAVAGDEQAARLRFLATLAHELRTPLNSVIGFADMLSAELFGKFEHQRQTEYVRLIRESGDHLLGIVNDMLDIAKIEQGTYEIRADVIDIDELVLSCCRSMAPEAERAGLTLTCEEATGRPDIVADPRACRQIMLNLLSNAIKFTDRGGRIACGTRRNGEAVELYVSDSGIGIAPADLPRLGTPFLQVAASQERRRAGTGLGLSLVKNLAALQGGSVDIRSELGAGTSVSVRLPASFGIADARAEGRRA